MPKTSAKKIVIVVTSGPYDSLKPYTAVKFAEKARSRGKDVKVIIKVSLSTHKHTHTSMQCQIASMVWYSDIEEKSLKSILI